MAPQLSLVSYFGVHLEFKGMCVCVLWGAICVCFLFTSIRLQAGL